MTALARAPRITVPLPHGAATGAPDGVTHRPMALSDLDPVLGIEVRAYSHPWSRANFVDSLAAGYWCEMRLDSLGRCLAYSIAMPGVEEMHLLNLTVDPAFQRRGHGRALLRRLARASRARGDRQLWLEVRASNQAALALYQSEGYAQAGLRKGYYPLADARREDAVVMSLELAGECDALD